MSSACPDDKGCELATNDGDKFAPPDDAYQPAPPEGPVNPAEPKLFDASCADVARSLAALDLGNYAEPDELEPVRAKYETACVRYRFAAAERSCLYEARDKWHIAYCVPRLRPNEPVRIVEPTECEAFTKQVRARHAHYNPRTHVDAQLEELDASCKQDRWPEDFAACIRNQAYLGQGQQPARSCHHTAPGWLVKKLEVRFAAAAKVTTK